MYKPNKNNKEESNKSLRYFDEPNKIKLYSEEEIYDNLNKNLEGILEQITNHRNRKGKYPKNVTNMFYNISSAKYLYEYIKEYDEDLTEDEIISLKTLISQGYKESMMDNYQISVLDYADRNDYLRKSYHLLAKDEYKIAKKLGLDKSKTDELIIYAYMEPKYSMRNVINKFDLSDISKKKKMKIFKKLYNRKKLLNTTKDNLYDCAIGTALTVNMNSSSTVALIFSIVKDAKKKERKKYLEEYAIAFKKIEKSTMLLNKDFYDDNKKIIKKLIKKDIGYKKAFDMINSKGKKRDNITTNKKDDKKKNNEPKVKLNNDFSTFNEVYKTSKK